MRDTTTILCLTLALCASGSLVGCGEESPPPSVQQFLDDPILLDATMVRCVANRDSVSYEPECLNARKAVERIAAVEESARRAALEAESKRKREARRRAQEAADEARRQAAETQRLRTEAQLLELIPTTPGEPVEDSGELSFIEVGEGDGAARVAVQDVSVPAQGTVQPEPGEPSPAGSRAPPATTDLGEIREPLEQRQPAPRPQSSNQGV